MEITKLVKKKHHLGFQRFCSIAFKAYVVFSKEHKSLQDSTHAEKKSQFLYNVWCLTAAVRCTAHKQISQKWTSPGGDVSSCKTSWDLTDHKLCPIPVPIITVEICFARNLIKSFTLLPEFDELLLYLHRSLNSLWFISFFPTFCFSLRSWHHTFWLATCDACMCYRSEDLSLSTSHMGGILD